jgi:hypothetical protein
LSWLRDDAKLEGVRARMADDDLGALVVRAPDNVLYPLELLADEGLVGFGKSVKRASLYSWMSPVFASLPDRRALTARSAAQRRSLPHHAPWGSSSHASS